MNTETARLSAERYAASQGKRPVVYVGRPLHQLLDRLADAIECGQVGNGQIFTSKDEVGLPFVEVIPA